jgi:hypothetical protein
MIQEASMVAAPAANLDGVVRAIYQLNRVRQPGWTVDYDRRTDTMSLRAPGAGPAISYFLPEGPEIVFRLDAVSGQLTGIDLERIHSVLARTDPEFATIVRNYRIATALGRLPGLRRLMRSVQRGVQSSAWDEVEQQAQRLCPTA